MAGRFEEIGKREAVVNLDIADHDRRLIKLEQEEDNRWKAATSWGGDNRNGGCSSGNGRRIV